MNQNAAMEINVSSSNDDGLTAGIKKYDTPKVNHNGVIIIPRDVICLKPETYPRTTLLCVYSIVPWLISDVGTKTKHPYRISV